MKNELLNEARQYHLKITTLNLLSYQKWYWRVNEKTQQRIRTYNEWLRFEIDRRKKIQASRNYPAFVNLINSQSLIEGKTP